MEEHPNPMRKTPSQIAARSHWKRSLVEINGKLRRNHVHDMSPMIMQSYSEIWEIPHRYYYGEPPCRFHLGELNFFAAQTMPQVRYAIEILGKRWIGIAAMEFDPKGIYLASATRSGCLTVHDFESLYYSWNDEGKQLLHISVIGGISAVRWNPANQDEVACSVSNIINEVHIFDIGHIYSKPAEVLRKRSVYGRIIYEDSSDIVLFNDGARVLASDVWGSISLWDRRASNLPQTGLTTNSNNYLNSIQIKEDQCVYGGSNDGFIYIWDLRGGRSSSAYQSRSETHFSSPLISVKLAPLLNKIVPFKAGGNIIRKEIHSIDINPSCPNQLGFHLDDGCSGVLDLHDFNLSHIHSPPPLRGQPNVLSILFQMKPSWIPEHSIYAVGSTSSQILRLLDFYPNTSSPCHVDYDGSKSPNKENRFVPLSDCVTACATHPLNGAIVAGTKKASLIIISQKQRSYKKEEDGDVQHS